jgi:hypothetical protein
VHAADVARVLDLDAAVHDDRQAACLGNARAGFMAEQFGLARSILWGGVICVAGVALCVPLLPKFWRYTKSGKSGAVENTPNAQ